MSSPLSSLDHQHMQLACRLALRGEGLVEPNPMVGCVIADGSEVLGKGWHGKFGGPHAEVEAIRSLTDSSRRRLADATLYVTLEPCCHTGKTPPCTEAILATPIPRVVVAVQDPFAKVSGRGIETLRQQGREAIVGIEQQQAQQILAPFAKRQQTGMPWVIAKWAMTWDGKIATRQQDSQWISNSASRRLVHQLRGRVDAIMVGSGTAAADDPMLTARPPGPRQALRVVLDSHLALPLESRLVQTAGDVPVCVVTPSNISSDPQRAERATTLERHGVEVLQVAGQTRAEQITELLQELGRRGLSNLLVEGGGGLLGAMLDGQLIDEVHAFVAPRLVGGQDAISPIAGEGVEKMMQAPHLHCIRTQLIGNDVYLQGRVQR